MTSEITLLGQRSAMQERIRKQLAPAPAPRLPVVPPWETGIAVTFAIARNQGGVGASTLALMLSYLHEEQPFIVQAGGLASWAYRHLSGDDYRHLDFRHGESRFSQPLDCRLGKPDRVAIIEYAAEMPREALEGAVYLQDRLGAHIVSCIIASRDDEELKLAQVAAEQGLKNVVLFRERCLKRELRSDVIKIPTMPAQMAASLLRTSANLSEELPLKSIPVERSRFFDQVHKMGLRIAQTAYRERAG